MVTGGIAEEDINFPPKNESVMFPLFEDNNTQVGFLLEAIDNSHNIIVH